MRPQETFQGKNFLKSISLLLENATRHTRLALFTVLFGATACHGPQSRNAVPVYSEMSGDLYGDEYQKREEENLQQFRAVIKKLSSEGRKYVLPGQSAHGRSGEITEFCYHQNVVVIIVFHEISGEYYVAVQGKMAAPPLPNSLERSVYKRIIGLGSFSGIESMLRQLKIENNSWTYKPPPDCRDDKTPAAFTTELRDTSITVHPDTGEWRRSATLERYFLSYQQPIAPIPPDGFRGP